MNRREVCGNVVESPALLFLAVCFVLMLWHAIGYVAGAVLS